MEKFYIIVSTIAVMFLILFLTFMGVLLRFQSSNEIYPPQSNSCPDYWTADSSGNCFKPTQPSFANPSELLNVGTIQSVLSSNSSPFSSDGKSFNKNNLSWSANGQSALCAQKTWCNNNGIIWDGVSNYNQC